MPIYLWNDLFVNPTNSSECNIAFDLSLSLEILLLKKEYPSRCETMLRENEGGGRLYICLSNILNMNSNHLILFTFCPTVLKNLKKLFTERHFKSHHDYAESWSRTGAMNGRPWGGMWVG